ncbi:MAG: hypothetical protein NTX45_27100 [Proteobacteria bacterium]|nr:hypothetical protein [Pseudomonadota bacterium]
MQSETGNRELEHCLLSKTGSEMRNMKAMPTAARAGRPCQAIVIQRANDTHPYPLPWNIAMTPHTESIELRADGRLLRFSSNLLSFLADREDWRRFHLSDWLQSLDEDRLGHLQQLAETALHDPQAIGTALEDLVSVVLHALAAERQALEVTFAEDELGQACRTAVHAGDAGTAAPQGAAVL